MKIHVDPETLEALTSRVEHEDQTLNDVLRKLLNLPSKAAHHLQVQNATFGGQIFSSPSLTANLELGLHSRGLFLPEGTELRATYKGRQYSAQIKDGVISNKGGKKFTSPSSAANSITGTTVNGWRFWEAKRPNDLNWYRLDQLP